MMSKEEFPIIGVIGLMPGTIVSFLLRFTCILLSMFWPFVYALYFPIVFDSSSCI